MVTRLNLSTPSNDVLDTLIAESAKARYWMIKQYGGEKGYEDMRDSMLEQSVIQSKTIKSPLVEYKSQLGNRWIIWEQATFYGAGSNSNYKSFCYYETLGSVGMFLLTHPQHDCKVTQVMIFTSHFFERWCERKNIKMNGRNTIIDFMTDLYGISLVIYPNNDGLSDIDIRMKDCICRGKQRADNPNVFEIRTILTDDQLTSKQKMYTQLIRERGDIFNKYAMPEDMLVADLMLGLENAEDKDAYQEQLFSDCSNLTGLDVKSLKRYCMLIESMCLCIKKCTGKMVMLKPHKELFDRIISLDDDWHEHKISKEEYKDRFFDIVIYYAKKAENITLTKDILKSSIK